jgi:NAD(P)H-quinone oxidoreductase subunit 5
LGAYLLLRVSPILEASRVLSLTVVFLGLASAVFGSIAARVQTDIKSALAFASLTQVGIIVAEIGCGLRYIPLIHIMGHACLRTLQLLRAPTLLHDYHSMENAIGARLERPPSLWVRLIPERGREWLYRLSIERGFLDAILDEYIVRPFLTVFRWSDRMERCWTDLLSGEESRESDQAKLHTASPEDFL